MPPLSTQRVLVLVRHSIDVCLAARVPRRQIDTRTHRQRFRLICAEHQEAAGAVRQNWQILLHNYKRRHCGLVHLTAAFRVIDTQRVRVAGAVRLAVKGAPLAVRCLDGDAAAEMRPGGHLDFASVRQTLRGFS